MGGSNVFCATAVLNKKGISIKCPTNSIIDYENVIYGVMDQSILNQDYCTNKAIELSIKKEKLYNCSSLIDDTKFKT
jgi:hypothetical protein